MTQIVGADERVVIELTVNGSRERVPVSPSDYLVMVLRGTLGLTGVKVACGMANCGACTVLLDGTPVYSCIMPALDAAGHNLTTIEGLGGEDGLHPVQAAFVQEDALQCGFCTPGQILSMSALFDKNPQPSEDEVRRAMSGNLCRCGAYVKIMNVSEKLKATKDE